MASSTSPIATSTLGSTKGYSKNGGTGSVKDYYRDNSMGQFVPNFTVVGPYTLDHERTYYAADLGGTGNDVNPQALVIEAAQKAKADHPEIDFSKFDNDGDGYMDNINVVIGGYSQASSGDDKDMWPHSYRLKTSDEDLSIEIDGIRVNNYSVSAELVGASGTNMDGIGTFTHEFGHILGLKICTTPTTTMVVSVSTQELTASMPQVATTTIAAPQQPS